MRKQKNGIGQGLFLKLGNIGSIPFEWTAAPAYRSETENTCNQCVQHEMKSLSSWNRTQLVPLTLQLGRNSWVVHHHNHIHNQHHNKQQHHFVDLKDSDESLKHLVKSLDTELVFHTFARRFDIVKVTSVKLCFKRKGRERGMWGL